MKKIKRKIKCKECSLEWFESKEKEVCIYCYDSSEYEEVEDNNDQTN